MGSPARRIHQRTADGCRAHHPCPQFWMVRRRPVTSGRHFGGPTRPAAVCPGQPGRVQDNMQPGSIPPGQRTRRVALRCVCCARASWELLFHVAIWAGFMIMMLLDGCRREPGHRREVALPPDRHRGDAANRTLRGRSRGRPRGAREKNGVVGSRAGRSQPAGRATMVFRSRAVQANPHLSVDGSVVRRPRRSWPVRPGRGGGPA